MAYKKHKIVNSQFVQIEQTPASVGARIGAIIIDFIILFCVYFASINALYSFRSSFLFLIVFLIPTLYTPICEQLFNGMTIGKAALGIRVVQQNGESVSIGASITRWMFMLIDCYYFGLGVFFMLCNKRNMRLGDMAAGTIVIKERKSVEHVEQLSRLAYLEDDYKPQYPFAADFTWGQIQFINDTIMETNPMVVATQEGENLHMLASKIADKYNVTVSQRDHNAFLKTLVSDYNYYSLNEL